MKAKSCLKKLHLRVVDKREHITSRVELNGRVLNKKLLNFQSYTRIYSEKGFSALIQMRVQQCIAMVKIGKKNEE